MFSFLFFNSLNLNYPANESRFMLNNLGWNINKKGSHSEAFFVKKSVVFIGFLVFFGDNNEIIQIN